ncbi:MAG: DUF1080 domain-containing protein [Acidobacteria bacterium]|jgi:hypothetical protein|nr:DUF1080 domain-containing protein [Acidobacteriota bacterium]
MRHITTVLSILLFTTSVVEAQERPRPRALAAEWQSLFNGTDLSGWKKVGQEKWEVVDGAIFGQGITEEYGYLVTEKSYRDFHLSLQFKCEADGNSGVYIHTEFKGDTPEIIAGRQVEIDRTLNHHTGGIYGDGKGWVAWPSPQFETVIRPYEWNDMLIEVEGNHYVVHLNGIQVLDFTYPSPGSEEGPIALQLHSGGQGKMRFKNLFVRDLSAR